MKNLPILIVTLVIGIVMVVTAVIPLAADYSEAKTFRNEGLWMMKPFETGDNWVMSEPGVWSYNGQPAITTDNSTSSVMIGDDWTVRGTGGIYGHTIYNASPTTVNVTVGESSTSVNASSVSSVEGYGVVAEGDYIVTKYDTPVYLHGGSPIWATGYTNFAGVSCVIHVEGTITDGVTVICSTINNTTALSNFEITDLKINATKNTSYVDLYKLESITFIVTCDYTVGGTTTQRSGEVSYSSYVVPYEITAEPNNPDTFKNMVRIVPLIALVVLVAGAASMIYLKGKE